MKTYPKIIFYFIIIFTLLYCNKAKESKNDTSIANTDTSKSPKEDIAKSEKKALKEGLTGIKPLKITASDFQIGQNKKFESQNVADDDLQTWWSPISSENLDKIWIKLEFAENENVKGVEIMAGSHYPDFPKYGNLYDKNYRIEEARLVFSDGSSHEFRLQDFDAIQTIEFEPRKTKYIKLVPISVFPTTKWKDVCISHLVALKDE